MQCLEVSGAVRPIYGLLGVKRLTAIGYDVKNEWTYTSVGPYVFTPGGFTKHSYLIILVISEVITAVLLKIQV